MARYQHTAAQWEKDRVRLSESQRRAAGPGGRGPAGHRFHARYDTVAAPSELAGVFGRPAGVRLLKRTYRTGSDERDAPCRVTESYLLYEQAARNPRLLDVHNEPWPGGSQHQLYTIGVEVDRIADRLTARAPSAAEIEELRLPAGVPVIALRQISIDIRDRVVEVSDAVLPADGVEFRYTTRLCRWQA